MKQTKKLKLKKKQPILVKGNSSIFFVYKNTKIPHFSTISFDNFYGHSFIGGVKAFRLRGVSFHEIFSFLCKFSMEFGEKFAISYIAEGCVLEGKWQILERIIFRSNYSHINGILFREKYKIHKIEKINFGSMRERFDTRIYLTKKKIENIRWKFNHIWELSLKISKKIEICFE